VNEEAEENAADGFVFDNVAIKAIVLVRTGSCYERLLDY